MEITWNKLDDIIKRDEQNKRQFTLNNLKDVFKKYTKLLNYIYYNNNKAEDIYMNVQPLIIYFNNTINSTINDNHKRYNITYNHIIRDKNNKTKTYQVTETEYCDIDKLNTMLINTLTNSFNKNKGLNFGEYYITAIHNHCGNIINRLKQNHHHIHEYTSNRLVELGEEDNYEMIYCKHIINNMDLTERQIKIAELMLKDVKQKDMPEILNVGIATIKREVKVIKTKLMEVIKNGD